MDYSSKKKWFILGSLLLLIVFVLFFIWQFSYVNQMRIQEKMIDRDMTVDLIEELTTINHNWNEDDYLTALSFVVTYLNEASGNGLYSELFDENIQSITRSTPLFDGTPFNPHDYEELIHSINSNDSAKIDIWFDKTNVEPHYLNLYYRWIPTNESRMLIIVGVSKFSINTDIGNEWVYGAAALLVFTSIIILRAIYLICELGNIGMKEREKNGEV